jgi:hypothetical protein
LERACWQCAIPNITAANGARALLAQAVEAAVAALLSGHADKLTDDGRQRMVRHGHLPEREIMIGIGPVAVRCPGDVAAKPAEIQKTAEITSGPTNPAPAIGFRQPLPVDPPKKGTAGSTLGRRLGRVSDAWDKFQDDRGRDAVYGYLRAVFALVKRYGGRRRTRRLVRRAFKFAGLPVDNHADPFAVVIRCTSDGKADNKTISKWARALRYVAAAKRPRHRLKAFMKSRGGVNACTELYPKIRRNRIPS